MLAVISFRCDESLPEYKFPDRVIEISITKVEEITPRQTPNGRQQLKFHLQGENVYDEVFQDSVDIKGSIRVWWERMPELYRTFTLNTFTLNERDLIHNGKMTILPGQRFSMDVVWDLRNDQGLYLPEKMNLTRTNTRVCGTNIICADPETFVVEASLNVFDRLGYANAEPRKFNFVFHTCQDICKPPCGTSLVGCD